MKINELINFKFLKRTVELIYYFVPFLLVFSIALLILETITYPGFTRKVLLLSSKEFSIIIFFISLVSILSVDHYNKFFKTLLLNVFSFNLLILPVLSFFYFSLIIEQNNNTQNYVFSTYHIHVSQFKLVLIYSIAIFTLSIVNTNRKKIIKFIANELKMGENAVIRQLIFVLILIFILKNTFSILENISENFSHIIVSPFATFEEKQKWKIGEIDYYKFIVNNTPQDSTILVPPQTSPWLTVGNVGYIRYFLYPRNIVSGKIENNSFENIDYVLIAKGTWPASNENLYGWPKQRISAEKIIFFNMEKNTTEFLDSPYFDLNNDLSYKYRWGLIKLYK